MTPREAALAVLGEAGGPLHRTVVLDRALRAGYLDPFTTPDVRAAIFAALRELAADGVIVRADKGVYEASPKAPPA
jgi:uridylate kinase